MVYALMHQIFQMSMPLLPLNPMVLLQLGEVQQVVEPELQLIQAIQKYIQIRMPLLP